MNPVEEIVRKAGRSFVPYEKDGYAVFNLRDRTLHSSSIRPKAGGKIVFYSIPKDIIDRKEFSFIPPDEYVEFEKSGLDEAAYAKEKYGISYVKKAVVDTLVEEENKKHKSGTLLNTEGIRFLFAPTLTKGIPSTTARFSSLIFGERLKNVLFGIREASDTEAMLILSDLSLEAPLNSTYARIYVHLAVQEMAKLGAPIQDKMLLEDANLSKSEEEELHHFKAEIYSKLLKEAEKICRSRKAKTSTVK